MRGCIAFSPAILPAAKEVSETDRRRATAEATMTALRFMCLSLREVLRLASTRELKGTYGPAGVALPESLAAVLLPTVSGRSKREAARRTALPGRTGGRSAAARRSPTGGSGSRTRCARRAEGGRRGTA